MSRPLSLVERVEHLLHDSAPDEIAVLLNISEAEVRRIAQLLDERGPADPRPLAAEDVAAVVEVVDDLPDEPVIYGDDVRRLLSSDPDNADALARAALLTVAEHSGSRYDVEDLAGMLGLTGALTDWQPSAAAVEPPGTCRCIEISPRTLEEPAAWEQADDCPVHPLTDPEPSPVAHYVGLTDSYFDEPGKPDTLAPTRPMTRALAEHVAAYAIQQPDGTTVALDVTPDGTATYIPTQAGRHTVVDVTPDPERMCACGHPRREHRSDGCIHGLDRFSANAGCPCPNAADWIGTPAAHVHDPFPVADEHGVFHAECECGTRWDRATCDTCGLPVTALVIAETGMRRHKHHQATT